jgi:hypothetical protein
MRVLLRSTQTVSLLRKRLRPAVAVDSARLNRLVAELDSDDFAVREEATRGLAALGDRAESALRKALPKAGAQTLELGRRAKLGEHFVECGEPALDLFPAHPPQLRLCLAHSCQNHRVGAVLVWLRLLGLLARWRERGF